MPSYLADPEIHRIRLGGEQTDRLMWVRFTMDAHFTYPTGFSYTDALVAINGAYRNVINLESDNGEVVDPTRSFTGSSNLNFIPSVTVQYKGKLEVSVSSSTGAGNFFLHAGYNDWQWLSSISLATTPTSMGCSFSSGEIILRLLDFECTIPRPAYATAYSAGSTIRGRVASESTTMPNFDGIDAYVNAATASKSVAAVADPPNVPTPSGTGDVTSNVRKEYRAAFAAAFAPMDAFLFYEAIMGDWPSTFPVKTRAQFDAFNSGTMTKNWAKSGSFEPATAANYCINLLAGNMQALAGPLVQPSSGNLYGGCRFMYPRSLLFDTTYGLNGILGETPGSGMDDGGNSVGSSAYYYYFNTDSLDNSLSRWIVAP